MFSATWPEEVRNLAKRFQRHPVFLNVGSLELSANPNIKQIIEVIGNEKKADRIVGLIKDIRKDPVSYCSMYISGIESKFDTSIFWIKNKKGSTSIN